MECLKSEIKRLKQELAKAKSVSLMSPDKKQDLFL